MTQRTDRLDELLRQEIGLILSREVKDPRIGFATVTKVQTVPDLGHAVVWVSVIGESAARTETLRGLEHVMHFVRRELGTRLRLRRIPELHVRLDDSAERGTRILHLIEELGAGRPVPIDDVAPDGETLPTPVVRLRQAGDLDAEPPAAAEPPGAGKRARANRGPAAAGGRPTRGRPANGGGKSTRGPRRPGRAPS